MDAARMALAACMALAAGPLLAVSVAPAAAEDPAMEMTGGPTYYVAIGDSLAAGYQPIGDPGRDHMTRMGYADQLWLVARARYPNLELVNLACPGENTETMRLDNGRCAYAYGSQLDEALAFITAHGDDLAFITIDVGFNDFPCTDELSCLFPGIDSIEAHLPSILAELQAAAPSVPIVGMDIYDPFLTFWLTGDEGKVLARQSVVAVQLLNEALRRVYDAARVPIADVEAAYAIDDWQTIVPVAGLGPVPRNLALLCERTWMCFPPPLGPDRHPNVLGARVIADAFAEALGWAD